MSLGGGGDQEKMTEILVKSGNFVRGKSGNPDYFSATNFPFLLYLLYIQHQSDPFEDEHLYFKC